MKTEQWKQAQGNMRSEETIKEETSKNIYTFKGHPRKRPIKQPKVARVVV